MTQLMPIAGQALDAVTQEKLNRYQLNLVESRRARSYKLIEQSTRREYGLKAIYNIGGSFFGLLSLLL